MKNATKLLLGRREKANFPELQLFNIDAKVDTGAYTSSIHCHDIREVGNQLYCKFLDPAHPDYQEKEFQFNTYARKTVKSSNGQIENRYKITTKIELGERRYSISLTLTDRAKMKYPVLLGRKFLSRKFIVDVSLKYQLKSNNTDNG
ncbi:MAG: ATP-dependent zinc protease [Lewinellaceae bacterium]|nr:ATP-dependent zinc protease [Saprospiraceae bacterium]MCB9330079.1 ATP-dependent zinc protease [Lewinellaceae bacterium]